MNNNPDKNYLSFICFSISFLSLFKKLNKWMKKQFGFADLNIKSGVNKSHSEQFLDKNLGHAIQAQVIQNPNFRIHNVIYFLKYKN